jgi:hypothetical protein
VIAWQNAGKSAGERLVIKLPSMQTSWSTTPARAFDCRARSFEFDLLDPVGGQDGDLAALQLV